MPPGLRLPFAGDHPLTQGFGTPAHQLEPAGWLASSDGKEWRARRIAFDGATKVAHCHYGIDWGMPSGTALRAMEAGLVTERGYDPISGYYIVVRIRPGTWFYFGHCERAGRAHEGDQVARGQVVARSGASGAVTGAHVHVEVRHGGVSPYFRYNVKRLLVGGDKAAVPWIRPG